MLLYQQPVQQHSGLYLFYKRKRLTPLKRSLTRMAQKTFYDLFSYLAPGLQDRPKAAWEPISKIDYDIEENYQRAKFPLVSFFPSASLMIEVLAAPREFELTLSAQSSERSLGKKAAASMTIFAVS